MIFSGQRATLVIFYTLTYLHAYSGFNMSHSGKMKTDHLNRQYKPQKGKCQLCLCHELCSSCLDAKCEMMLPILFSLPLCFLDVPLGLFRFPLGFFFFFLTSLLPLLQIGLLDRASLVLWDKDRVSKAWGFSSIDKFGHFVEIGLFDPVDDWVYVEGSLVVEVALRIIIVVQCLAGCMQSDGEFLLNRNSGVQSPVVKVIREISGIGIEKDGIDDITILLVIVVVDMQLDIMQFAMDDVFGNMVEVEAVGLENLGDSISGDVYFGKIKRSSEVYIRNVICDLHVQRIL